MSETSFQDTPLYAWLRGNAWFLLAGVAIVGGVVTYRNLSAQWGVEAREKSWNEFRLLAAGDPTGPDLSTRLQQAKADQRIYPWVVLEATRQAVQDGDKGALEVLRPELSSLAADERIRVATPAGGMGMAAFLLKQLDSRSATPLPQEFNSAEPAGRKIEIVVSLGEEKTYAVTVGLYEAQSPAGTAALMEWIAAGRLAGQTARKIGSTGLTMNMVKLEQAEGADAPPTLYVERAHGIFHEEGMLSMLQLPGQFGAQDSGAIQLLLTDMFQLDGQATVLGKATEGFPELKAAVEAAGTTATMTVVSARAL
jgi:hypothetical protein